MTNFSTVGPVPLVFDRDRFQILALDGGGAKALFTAHVLANLERDLGQRITDHFDLIAGTSAGGIIALALGAGLSPAEVLEHYTALVDRVFPRRRQRRWRVGRLFAPAYDSSVLREVLHRVFGDRILGDSTKRLIVPSWDVRSGQVHIFKTPHHDRLIRDWRLSMVDVAMATAAAPVYFRAANVDRARLIDGGVWANNPSVIAITEAYSMLGVPLDKMRVLNIGTLDPVPDHSPRIENGGLVRWSSAAVSTILYASSSGGVGTARHLVGYENFVRLDARVPPKRFTVDKVNATDVAGYASSASRNLSSDFVAKFADHWAAAYEPIEGRCNRSPSPRPDDGCDATEVERSGSDPACRRGVQ